MTRGQLLSQGLYIVVYIYSRLILSLLVAPVWWLPVKVEPAARVQVYSIDTDSTGVIDRRADDVLVSKLCNPCVPTYGGAWL